MRLFSGSRAQRNYLIGAVLWTLFFVGNLWWTTSHVIHNSNAIALSRLIITDAHIIMTAMLNAETGARGYAITGKELYLQPYVDGRALLKTQQQQMLAHQQQQPVNSNSDIARLLILTGENLTILQAAIDFLRSGSTQETPQRASQIFDQGKTIMDTIRQVDTNIIEREQRSIREVQQVLPSIITTMIIDMIGLLGCVILFTDVGRKQPPEPVDA